MKKSALVILHPGFEEMEAAAPIDLLHRGGITVVQAALGDALLVPGRNGISFQASHHLKDLLETPWDAIVLPGGPGIQEIRNHPVLCGLLQKQHQAGRWIACICAAPLLLLDAGLASGRRICAHPSAEGELDASAKGPVEQDGTLITSRGAGTATEFGLTLLQALTDSETAASVAQSICWEHGIS